MYVPPAADFPVVTNTVISSTHFNNTINDLATGLTTCLTKDGQTTPTANIKLGGFKLVNVGPSTVSGDALVFGSAGTVTTLTATTGVLTPLLQSSGAVDLVLGANSGTDWNIASTGKHWLPGADGTQNIGSAVKRIATLFASIADSGSGALVLKGAGTTAQTITGANTVFAGTITPTQTGGIVGTTTNNDVQAGSVGELITASLAVGSQINLTNNVPANIISISLTAGDWDVSGVLHFNYGATDSIGFLVGSTSSTSATHGAVDTQTQLVFPSAGQVNGNQTPHRMSVPMNRFKLSGTTTVFLVATAAFTGGYASHGMIRARRIR